MIRLRYCLVIIFSFITGRLVGQKTQALFFSMDISNGESLLAIFVLAAVFFSMVIDPIENKYLWPNNNLRDFWFDRLFMGLAPINTGLTGGVITVWAVELI